MGVRLLSCLFAAGLCGASAELAGADAWLPVYGKNNELLFKVSPVTAATPKNGWYIADVHDVRNDWDVQIATNCKGLLHWIGPSPTWPHSWRDEDHEIRPGDTGERIQAIICRNISP